MTTENASLTTRRLNKQQLTMLLTIQKTLIGMKMTKTLRRSLYLLYKYLLLISSLFQRAVLLWLSTVLRKHERVYRRIKHCKPCDVCFTTAGAEKAHILEKHWVSTGCQTDPERRPQKIASPRSHHSERRRQHYSQAPPLSESGLRHKKVYKNIQIWCHQIASFLYI